MTAWNVVWCQNHHAEASIYCPEHLAGFARRAAQNQAAHDERERYAALLNELFEHNPLLPWTAVARGLFERQDFPEAVRQRVAYDYALHVAPDLNPGVFHNLWWGMRAEGHVAQLPPQGDVLARLARDNQNVHTAPVVAQTQSMETKLLEVPIPADQQTEATLVREWLRLLSTRVSWARILKTMNDIHIWFGKSMCRRENDNLYRRLLRGAVAKIARTDGELQAELYRRIWEECTESIGMCCEGHISRLCNVFVGFDEAFQPPISIGELLQQKMAAISQLDIPTEMKHVHAHAVFDELGVAADDRMAWIDAF